MQQSCSSTFRRGAAIGAVVVVLTTSSAFGIGAATASAAPAAAPAAAGSVRDARTSTTSTAAAPGTTTPATTTTGTPGAAGTASTSTDSTSTASTSSPDAPPAGTVQNAPTTPTTAEPTGSATQSAADPAATPAPTAAPTPTTLDATAPAAPAAPTATTTTATITGTVRIGQVLHVTTTGFTGATTTAWTSNGKPAGSETTYTITPADAGHVIAVTVSSTVQGEAPATASTTAVPDQIAFTEQSTPEAPIRLASTAGERFAHQFTATGSATALHYLLLSGPTAFPVPGNDHPIAPESVSLDESTGFLSGAPTTAGEYDFQVMAANGNRAATEYVHLSVRPAAAKTLQLFIDDPSDAPLAGAPGAWGLGEDGRLLRYLAEASDDASGPVDAVRLGQGGSLVITTTPLDAYGNDTRLAGTPTPTVTSSRTSDAVAGGTSAWDTVVRFPEAGRSTITVTDGTLTTSFAVDVEQRTAASAVGHHTGAAPHGTLAYTGSDESGPLAWALGLLAAGAGLLVHRLRRRRI
ncbi:hypothetical protein [Curtobacterium sp. ISL-83]|uniref:hypothetical protein n=1 Tax=Curtobacterium sp. ISL-83 TaxID=2819145 RepID=UPI001BECF692|nr:hypothetical protein [Curtobacterium sp. ISL-83]MBT2500928.1 hypothetical protein [Curtobacterium sp. ISL-83]